MSGLTRKTVYLSLLLLTLLSFVLSAQGDSNAPLRRLNLRCSKDDNTTKKVFFTADTSSEDFKEYLRVLCNRPVSVQVVTLVVKLEEDETLPPQPSLLAQLLPTSEPVIASVLFVDTPRELDQKANVGRKRGTVVPARGGLGRVPILPELNFGDLELDIDINATTVTQTLNQQAHTMPISLKLEAPNLPMSLSLSGENLPMSLTISRFEVSMINWSVWIVLTVLILVAFVMIIVQHYRIKELKKQVKFIRKSFTNDIDSAPLLSQDGTINS